VGLAIFVSIFFLPKLSVAVDGISSGKLIMPWAYTMDKGAFEFEPAVSSTTFDDVLDSDGKLVSLEGRYQISTIDIRFTGGLTEKLEMGAAFGIESVNFHHEVDPLLDESETSLGDLAKMKRKPLPSNGASACRGFHMPPMLSGKPG